jgi:GDP-D-mannose dehydratase
VTGVADDYVYVVLLMPQQERPVDHVITTGETHSVSESDNAAPGTQDWIRSNHIDCDQRCGRPAAVEYLLDDRTMAGQQLRWKRSVNFDGFGRSDGRRRLERHGITT